MVMGRETCYFQGVLEPANRPPSVWLITETPRVPGFGGGWVGDGL